jgi:hypothetical protein
VVLALIALALAVAIPVGAYLRPAVANTVLAALQLLDPDHPASGTDVAEGDLWHPVENDWQVLVDLYREAQEIAGQERRLRERKLAGENVDKEWSELQERRRRLQERVEDLRRRLNARRSKRRWWPFRR